MNRLENMETFVRIVENGGISAAADNLSVAKSVVSRRLRELENHLGVELFHRTTRKMNLTDTGQTYYQDCLRIIDQVQESEQVASRSHDLLQGNIRVALPYTFGTMHIGPAVNDFLRANPQIRFDLDFNDRVVDVMQERFDLAIRIATLSDSSLVARRIADVAFTLCASPHYLERTGTPEKPEDLPKHQCLPYSLTPDPERWRFRHPDGRETDVWVDAYLKASSGEYLLKASVDGHGIILLPTFIAYEQIERGTLVPLLRDYALPSLNAYAIYPQTRHLSQRVRSFVDFLVKRFEGVPYWDQNLE